MELQRTGNYEDHVLLGAKMVPFAGFEMPVQYRGIGAEHQAVREKAGIFDVSHMGEFIVKGNHSLSLIQQITSNDASTLKPGEAQYSLLTHPSGGIIDDLLVYNLGSESYMLVVNASNIEKDLAWIEGQNVLGAEIKNISSRTALLAVQGPLALSILQKLTSLNLSQIDYYTFIRGEMAGFKNIIISATGYTGAGGFELYFDTAYCRDLWKAILEAGKEYGLEPAGLGARDTLRLEMGYCLYGQDIDETTNPLEAGLGWITKLSKSFIGSEALLEVKKLGVSKKLMGFEMKGNAIARSHYPIQSAGGIHIGEVKSGTWSPSLKRGIGLGYILPEFAVLGNSIFIEIRGNVHEATLVKLPFLKK